MNRSLAGAAVAGLFSVGIVLLASWSYRFRRPLLDERLAPYLRDLVPPSKFLRPRELSRGPVAVLIRLAMPWVRDISKVSDRFLGSSDALRRRLDRLGRSDDVEIIRVQQLLCAACAAVCGSGVAAWLWWWRSAAVVPLVILVMVSTVTGAVLRDWWLTRQVVRREQVMLMQFPALAEMLALAVGAGEGPMAAIARVTRLSRGPLAAELGRVLDDVRAGSTAADALQRLGGRTGLAPLTRFVDGMVVAIERGTPLAEVLRYQAHDVREAGRRALMETAGTREIAMMIPVVFLILPITVLFAVFPGFAFLRLGW
ncbi:MAG: type II secretion system F family protein [Actinomycetota bacterium]